MTALYVLAAISAGPLYLAFCLVVARGLDTRCNGLGQDAAAAGLVPIGSDFARGSDHFADHLADEREAA